MGFLVRTLKFLMVPVLLAAVVLWFAARRGDRGYIEGEMTIDRSAPAVFRWITSDELLRRWISGPIKLEKSGPGGPAAQTNNGYRLDELIAGQRVVLDVKILRAIPNQELDLYLKDASGPAGTFACDASFRLFPEGEYTRLVLTSQTNFFSLRGQLFEPILTYAARQKMREDLARLKIMAEAEAATPPEVRGRAKER